MKDPLAAEAKELHVELDELLAKGLGDRALRDALEALNERRALPFVFYRLVRPLLERDSVLFAPLVRPRVDTWAYDRKGKWHDPWRTDEGKRDLAWLIEFAESRDDAPLFKAAMRVELDRGPWQTRNDRWCEALLARFERAREPHERASVLTRFAGLGFLDDPTACALYDAAPVVARGFIEKHLPFRPWGKRAEDQLPELLARTRDRDPELHFALYRQLAGGATWRRDVAVALQEATDDALVEELEKIHPASFVDGAAEVFVKVLEQRGDVGLPYVSRHANMVIRGFFGGGGYAPLVRIAKERGYDTLWAGLLRHAATPKEYNAEVERLARDGGTEARRRLALLAGVGRELNFPGISFARVQALEDEVAVVLYERHPELLRGPFKRQLFAGWHASYTKLVDTVLRAGDEDLIDFLASRFVTRGGRWMDKAVLKTAEQLSQHYERLRSDDPVEFAERAANVLGQVPPFVVFGYDELLATNRLARLLYELSPASYLVSARVVRDLLEAPEIHVQRLAFRALSLADDRARRAASDNLDLLVATLLRPLHRRTRLLAFDALVNAAHDPEAGARVLAAAREAMHLPDLRYPKEELVGLIGRVLALHPSLRRPREQPVVYRSA